MYLIASIGLSCSGDEFYQRSVMIYRGILGIWKEVYDLILDATDKKWVMRILTIILQRCHKYSITLSPKKCKLASA